MSEARVVQQMRQHVAESVMMARTAGHADTIYLPDVLEVIDTLTQRAEAAEAKLRDVAYWHEAWKEAEAERDALRKDAAAIAALREPISEGVDKGWSLLQTRCFESDPGMLDSVKYDDFQDALNAAIDAAMAVKPTTGEGDE